MFLLIFFLNSLDNMSITATSNLVSGDIAPVAAKASAHAAPSSALDLHCSLSGLARPQSTSSTWGRLVSTFPSSRSSDLRPRVAMRLPRR